MTSKWKRKFSLFSALVMAPLIWPLLRRTAPALLTSHFHPENDLSLSQPVVFFTTPIHSSGRGCGCESRLCWRFSSFRTKFWFESRFLTDESLPNRVCFRANHFKPDRAIEPIISSLIEPLVSCSILKGRHFVSISFQFGHVGQWLLHA